MTQIQLINTDKINQCKSVQSVSSVFNIFNNLKRLARKNDGARERLKREGDGAICSYKLQPLLLVTRPRLRFASAGQGLETLCSALFALCNVTSNIK